MTKKTKKISSCSTCEQNTGGLTKAQRAAITETHWPSGGTDCPHHTADSVGLDTQIYSDTARREVRTLPCELTDEELLEAGQALSRYHGELRRAEQEFDLVRRAHRDRVQALEAHVDYQADLIRSGREHREVFVLVANDYDTGTITVTREDTGEVLSTRPMTDSERQMSLNTEEAIND